MVSKSDLNKEAFAKKYKADPHRVVSRVSGATVTLPWTENFDDESSFDNFTVIDANEDFAGWEYVEGKAEYCCLFADYDADDWLITPGFNMVAGKKYQISFRANTFDVASPEEFSAWLGNAPEADAMTISVVGKTTIARTMPPTIASRLLFPPTVFIISESTARRQWKMHGHSISMTSVLRKPLQNRLRPRWAI